ncbi:MAG: acyltransferase [Alphaproteobacteria bacterium]|nr:acyltransferase [Alphaproteobacteria bacterium]
MQIDLLKTIGLLLIILAHVKPGYLLMQIRAFDVPLMILISGYLAQASYKRARTPFQYYLKRFLRLYIPTFLFLTFFFLFFYLTITPYPFTPKVIFRSFALLFSNTVNYVWIIRVFLLCALLVPFLLHLQKYIFSKSGIVWLIVVFMYYEFNVSTPSFSELYKEIVFYGIGYGFVLILGMWLQYLSKKDIYKISILFGFIYCSIAIYLCYQNGFYISVQQYKYPPQLYYLSYSISIGYFLFAITRKIKLKNTYPVIRFFSRYSLSIYLWHIFYLYLLKFYNLTAPWYLIYIGIVFFSCITSYLINKLFNKICNLTIKFLLPK